MENQQPTANESLAELEKDPKALEQALQKEVGAVDSDMTDQKASEKSEESTSEVEQRKKSTAERFEKILADRNEARLRAEEASQQKEALEKEVADLRSQFETLAKAGGPSKEGATEDSTLSEDKILDLVDKKVSEVLSKKERAELAEKSTAEEIEATANIPDFAGIKGRENEVKSVMAKHPTLTAAAAYLLLTSVEEGRAQSNADRLSVGSRSNSDLLRDKKPSEMTTKELNAELIRLADSGQLNF